MTPKIQLCIVLMLAISRSQCSDSTASVFGTTTNIMPASFGDFNSDESTDLFVINDDSHGVQIHLARPSQEPYFYTENYLGCRMDESYVVTGIAPGDYDGDDLMDIMVTARYGTNANLSYVFIHWGELNNSVNYLNCSQTHLLITYDEPLVIDYRLNMITDLFGLDENRTKTIWNFSKTRGLFTSFQLAGTTELKFPHSHAFLDMNDDSYADLFLTGLTHYEVWCSNDTSNPNFYNCMNIPYPSVDKRNVMMTQTILIDLQTTNQLVPVVGVYESRGRNSAIYSYIDGIWYNLEVSFKNSYDSKDYGFENNGQRYRDTVTFRAGDFNNDGFIDLLVTLQDINDDTEFKSFLLENVASSGTNFSRTFETKWNSLGPENGHTVMGTFFDFMQDGILDIIFVHLVESKYNISAFKNSLDYDANFMKVMVISEMTNSTAQLQAETSILGMKRFFGSNLPGPKVCYKTTTQDGNLQRGCATQLPQSAHFALYLPYTIFGLGRTPNFIEDLTIGAFNQTKQLSPIIPNSQLVIIIPDNAVTNPSNWRAQLFVTPSKIIWQTLFALLGTCVVICIIIGLLHWKEKREDRLEKLKEAHRFHFAT